MFDIVLEKIKKFITSRIFPVVLIYIILFGVLVNRLFVLQIVQGPVHAEEATYKETQNREIKSTRGNIYDRNGKILATNVLSYSVVMEDNTTIESNEQRNAIIYKLIKLIEKNKDSLDTEFPIVKDTDGNLKFTIDGDELIRFKENAFTYAIEGGKLSDEQKNATAKEVFDFLRHGEKRISSMFDISDEYSIDDALKIMSVRFALLCNYPKYLQVTIASEISEDTVAAVLENSADMPGVEVIQQTHRYYPDSLYFSHILGYTGPINSKELDEMNKVSDEYNQNDVIGKTGIEKEFETELGGKKGSEIITVNSAGKVINTVDHIDPVAGNDVYLTIDSDLQKASYHILEKKIAGILLSKITPDMNYGTKGESATNILTPIYEVYYALFNNNIIDIKRFESDEATDLEKQVLNKFKTKKKQVFKQLDNLLAMSNTSTEVSEEMKEYLDYFYTVLVKNEILLVDNIPKDNSILLDYQNNTANLSSFLQSAIANNWIDLSKLDIGTEYYSAEELYSKLIEYTKVKLLENDNTFIKKIYHNLIFSYELTGKEICLLLFDQGVLKFNQNDIDDLQNDIITACDFMKSKIKSLEITPAMLALEPCSGSVVITDVRNGDVLALVSYPSYDNNMLADKVDQDYYSKLLADLSKPLFNRPTQQLTAPGSTYKMVTSVAALEEGVVPVDEYILDLGIYDKVQPPAKCNIYPGSHGSVNIIDAIKVSCNYFFYEMGFRLSTDNSKNYNEQLGINRLKKYAEMFGLDKKSGVEIYEADPQISDKYPVPSAIGQGTNNYAPIQLARYVTTIANNGTCFNLTLLDSIKDKNNKKKDNKAEVLHKITDISPLTWKTIKEGMYSVVNVKDGSVYDLYTNLGVTVAGKTGTAQINKDHPNHALFVSYAPYENPEISITAVIPNGHTSHFSAELARDIYKYYFHLEKQSDLINSEVTLPDNNIGSYTE